MRKLIAAVALFALAGLGALAGLAGSASAAESTGIIKRYTTSYTSPSESSSPVHYNLAPGSSVSTLCFREGEPMDGNAYWFLIEKNGDRGYVHRDAIVPPAVLPHC
jgi:hypothetical protein